MLELKDIKIGFKEGTGTKPLLKGVNLSLDNGKIAALIGGNGTGKTTLLNIINGIEKTFQGTILYNGQDISRWPSYKIAETGVCRMFQGVQLSQDLTLLESLMVASNENPRDENPFLTLFRLRKIERSEKRKREQAIAALEYFFGKRPNDCRKFLNKLNDRVGDFSYGEQRIIGFISLLMNSFPQYNMPTLLLLDEPTSGVNMAHVETMKDIISDLVSTRNATVLFTEHNMEFVLGMADSCFFLDTTGEISMFGSPEKVLSDDKVRKNYLGYGG